MSDAALIIRDGAIAADDWTLIPAGDEADLASLPGGKIIVPLKTWIAERAALIERAAMYPATYRAPVGVWLEGSDDPALLADSIDQLALIAVNFPKFTDGRGYSTGALLRSRYGFKGELRAIGDVLRDQLFYMHRAGFNAYAVRADKDIHDALKALNDFSETYQGAVDQPLPLFKRRASLEIEAING
jgi:uncharacterized protein (DUF934 family)